MTVTQKVQQPSAPPKAQHVPVLIIGAGPVGVTAALLLARQGVRSLLLERHPGIYPLPRAVAVDDEVCRILQAAGVYEEFASISRPARGLRLLDARHRVIAEFPRSAHGHHGFPQTSMFNQPELEEVLRNALTRDPGRELVELITGVEVTAVHPDAGDGPVRVAFRRGDGPPEHLWADTVLGCDGAGSLTRQAIGATWEDLRFEERWHVIDVRTTATVACWEGVEQVCDPHQPATFMRIGEDRYRWEFRAHESEELDEARIRRLIAPWTRISPADDFDVIRKAQYTFRARLADRWRKGRVLLLGDAAHLTPPFIGQGLCAGIRDARNLTWKLVRVLREGADERILDTYEGERKSHARHLIRLAVVTGWAMTGGQDRAAALRRSAVAAVCRIPGVTGRAERDLSPALRPGPLIRRSRLGGTYCPQPEVTVDGRRVPLDVMLGDSFAVLSRTPLAPSAAALAEALGARVLCTDRLHDDGTIAAWLRVGRADAVLLRPDRVVMDAVPTGGSGFSEAAGWAPLLRSGRRAADNDRLHPTSETRSLVP